MPKPLVIVESPAKARTISRFLGNSYVVESSIGHIRDLPRSAAEVPSALKGSPWARTGVDIDNDFKPLYVVPKEKKEQVSKLKSLLKDASELYLATDEDREGESIAWHLLEVLSPKVPVRRMVFHEITEQAIRTSVDESRELDRRLVDAQEARRVLDRLVGYEVSPVLWRKVMRGLSAGRVQSVATRMVVERERARMRFRTATYWDVEALFASAQSQFGAVLVELDGSRLATGKDFNDQGHLTREDAARLDEAAARSLAEQLMGATFTVRTVDEKPFKRSPHPPFITSTLQQEAGRKLRFTARRAMQAAQRLYENGFITYMRTDSTTLSDQALQAARSEAQRLYGPDYVPEAPRRYERKVKNAQEAHEAIRPAGEIFQPPADVAAQVGADEAKLYELIWKRTVASQMTDARGQTLQVRIGTIEGGHNAEFAAGGRTITFPGFLRAYVEGSDDPEGELEDREVHLPPLSVGDSVDVRDMSPREHATQPPPRYTEASLVKALEDMGVGRPSTYASIMSTIQDRGYVWKKGSALVPSFLAFAVVGLLEGHFGTLVDYRFTADMEDDLDRIANGEQEAVPWLRTFYFGNGTPGLHSMVSEGVLAEIDAREINSISLGHDDGGREVVVRVGRYGPYIQRGEERASIPEGIAPDELTLERAAELLETGAEERLLGVEPDSGLPVVVKAGRYGPYVQVGEVVDGEKPRTASLFKTMEPGTITLDDALLLLRLPRVVGNHPEDGEEIIASNGRYGPYLKKGSDTRSLETEEQLLVITLDEALAVLAQPKQRRGQRSSAPIRELGTDPATGKAIVIKEGRFGPYMTDGEVNVSVPKSDNIEEISLERAAELLANKRAAGPSKRPAKRAAKSTKKAAAKKSKKAAKKTVKKSAAKKPAAGDGE